MMSNGRRDARVDLLLLAGLVVAAWATACGDGAVEPVPRPADPPRPTTVAVSPATAELTALGATARFTAEVRDQNGQAIAGATIAWASSDASVAAVDASGQVTAATNGNATITATAGSASGTAAVTVAQVVHAVNVSPASETLVTFGDTLRLVAEATDANGHAVAGATEFAWASSDTLVAQVDDTGLVETVAEGEVVVTATTSEVTGQAELMVVPPVPTTLAVSPDTVRFTALGQTAQLAAEVREQSGRVMGEALVAWASSDASVAAVDASGQVTAATNGNATITATSGGASGAATVTVAEPNVDAVFDSLMLAFTRERDIGAAALGIMRDGEIVYDRAFGWMDRARVRPVRQDIVMRVMSVSKVVTAVAIRRLVADGRISLDDYVFDLGQDAGGLLDLDPVPNVGDPRIAEITVHHALLHEGGWAQPATGAWWVQSWIAEATGSSVPVTREAMIRYLMGRPLGHTPGTKRVYTNAGFLVLGHIIETVSGQDYMDYVHETLFAPLGIGRQDFILARSLPVNRSDREPWYDGRGVPWGYNLFDPSGPLVPRPDGVWDLRVWMAYGGLAASTEALLKFIEVYQASHDEFLGLARRDGWAEYSGRHVGSEAFVRQAPSGVNYAFIFNKTTVDPGAQYLLAESPYSFELRDLIDQLLLSGRIVWP